MTLATRLAAIETQGRFYTRMAAIHEASAAKWPEFSEEQFAREVEALKAADMAEACRVEWRRAKAQPHTERDAG